MKKAVSLLVFVLAFAITTNAQEKKKRVKKESFTAEQQATLAVKKMALALELSDAQMRKIKPILKKQAEERKVMREKMRKAKEDQKKLSQEERYKKANAMLDKKLAFQKEMKSILNAEQYEKFQKLSKKREMGKRKKMAKHKKMMHKKKKHKHKEEKEDH